MSYVGNLKTFIRVYELGSMSAAGRDQRISAAVASARIAELEKHLGVRLFNRTTRSLHPTEQGSIFYAGAQKILEAIDQAEGAVADISRKPRGSLHVGAPLGIGKRLIAPRIPEFKDLYPEIDVRLRLSDRKIDITAEALDMAFVLGVLEDSNFRVRQIADCPRVLCASPAYLAGRPHPRTGRELLAQGHACLLHRFPGARDFVWTLATAEGPQRFEVSGPLESDDGDVLTAWALSGRGIMLKPAFEVAEYLASGELLMVCEENPPFPVSLACIFPHKRLQDPKSRLFIEFMVGVIKQALAGLPFGAAPEAQEIT
ncbi:MAG: LysR family transcriptional regulator [Amaricoccus sp.]|uniref:LysR family transcriptional regulator n=1 Tax=Amaricoccus sp. TaxID=1872485 RepID=UPI0039E52BB8